MAPDLFSGHANHRPVGWTEPIRGPPFEYWGGGGAGVFFEINIFVGKMGEINKWPQDMVEINILPTQEVEINII